MKVTTKSILENAHRLLADARHLHDGGRSRSAATLVVVALEQIGLFVETITKEKYPDAVVHMGIFGDKANIHAKRQDTVAWHIYNYALGRITIEFACEIFLEKTGYWDSDRFLQWLTVAAPLEFTDEQKQRMKVDKELRAAALLMQFVRQGRLKSLREYGFYEDADTEFTPVVIGQVIEMAGTVESILVKSQKMIVPEPMALAGVSFLRIFRWSRKACRTRNGSIGQAIGLNPTCVESVS